MVDRQKPHARNPALGLRCVPAAKALPLYLVLAAGGVPLVLTFIAGVHSDAQREVIDQYSHNSIN